MIHTRTNDNWALPKSNFCSLKDSGKKKRNTIDEEEKYIYITGLASYIYKELSTLNNKKSKPNFLNAQRRFGSTLHSRRYTKSN